MDIFEAAAFGDKARVFELIAHGWDINCTDLFSKTPLHFACKGGHIPLALALLEAGADISHEDVFSCTPFYAACSKGYKALAVALLQHGADINGASNDYTPLHAASDYGHTALALWLLEAGADINCINSEGNAPLHFACEKGDEELALALADAGADINCINSEGNAPWHSACEEGHEELALALVKKNSSGIHEKAFDAQKWLFFSCVKGYTALARALLGMGASVHEQDKEGNTALHIAFANRQASCAMMLIEKWADFEIKNQWGEMATGLFSIGFPREGEGHAQIQEAILARSKSMFEVLTLCLKRASNPAIETSRKEKLPNLPAELLELCLPLNVAGVITPLRASYNKAFKEKEAAESNKLKKAKPR